MPKPTDSEVRAIIASRLKETLNSTDSELRDDREKALDFYYGRPLGNEQDGRSQVVSRDIMDTIEWMMPSFMRLFCTHDAVQFDAVGEEDEQEAKEETGYVTHVLWKKNGGFMLIYTWAKDALMQKNGYVKYGWEEQEKICFDDYSGLTDDQLTFTLQELEQQGKVEIVGKEQDDNGLWSIKVRILKTYGCAKVEAVPPEEVVVDRNCRGDIKKARFVGHLRRNVSRSELIEQGYDRERVKNLTSYVWDADLSERLARDTVSENLNTDRSKDQDTASEELQLLEAFTYIDEDDDGKAELRKYLLAGNDILENEEAPEIQWESWTAIPVPHRHSGLSVYDRLEDLQRIKTALQRGLLDNVYFGNNRRLVYSQDIDESSLSINRPGGHIKATVAGPVVGLVQPVEYSPIAQHLLPVIDYFDSVKETRSGVGRMSTGVDANVLAQSTKGAYLDAKGAANQIIEGIARIFAETGLASLYVSLHRLLRRHQDWPTKFKLRKDWVQTNPANWRDRTDLTASVGLGNASREEIRANLMLMGEAQKAAAQVPGLIQPENVFSLFRRIQAELGFENEAFITDPQSPEFQQFMQSQQGRKDPYIEGEEIKVQGRLQEKQIDASIDSARLDQERDLKITELEVKSGVDLAKAGIGAEVAVARGAGAQGGNGAAASGKPGPERGVPGG